MRYTFNGLCFCSQCENRNHCFLSWLGFFLLIAMRDDVTERLVVDVASRVDGSESKGLIHLEVYEMTVCLVRIIKGRVLGVGC